MNFIRKILTYKDSKIILILIGLIILASILTDRFMTWQNMAVILANVSIIGIISIGVTLLMISGEFDISVGAVFALAPFVMISLINLGLNYYIAFIICLLTGVFTGFLNGIIVTRFRINSFITTLATAMVWRGATLLISRGFPVKTPDDFILKKVLANKINGFPVQFIWFFGLTIILWIILEHHRFGNWIFATGGNRAAAESHGINTSRVKIINFTIVGALAAFAGLIQACLIGSVPPLQGLGMELSAIAATVIGGTLIIGGAGSIIGTFVGIIIISIASNTLILAGAAGFWYQLIVGLIILSIVILHNIKRIKWR